MAKKTRSEEQILRAPQQAESGEPVAYLPLASGQRSDVLPAGHCTFSSIEQE